MLKITPAIQSSLAFAMLPFLAKLTDACAAEKRFDLLVYCGARTGEEQNRIYCLTRNKAEIAAKAGVLRAQGFGKLADYLLTFPAGDDKLANVTNATAGESLHNYALAFDAVPTIGGKALWDNTAFYAEYGRLAQQCNLEWGGSWSTFREMPHCQLPNYSMDVVRAKLMLPFEAALKP